MKRILAISALMMVSSCFAADNMYVTVNNEWPGGILSIDIYSAQGGGSVDQSPILYEQTAHVTLTHACGTETGTCSKGNIVMQLDTGQSCTFYYSYSLDFVTYSRTNCSFYQVEPKDPSIVCTSSSICEPTVDVAQSFQGKK